MFSAKKTVQPLPAHDAGDAGFRINAVGVINGDGAGRAKEIGAKGRAAAAKLPGVEVSREDEFVVACRVVDHLPDERLSRGLFSFLVQEPREPLMAFRR